MSSIGNMKLTQLRKLFRIFRSSLMESLSICGAMEGTRFEFTISSYFWKIGEFPDRAGKPISASFQTAPLQTTSSVVSVAVSLPPPANFRHL
jgi:hypothetical protein